MKKLSKFLIMTLITTLLVACQPTATSTNSDQQQEISSTSTTVQNNTNITTNATSIEEQNALVLKDADDTIASLNAEWEKLATDINSFDNYKKNIDNIEAFYAKILEETSNLSIRMRGYSINYAKLIIASDKPYSEKYDELDEIYDTIYEDVGDKIYDEIYDGILDEMYDAFYDGIVDDAYDTVPYKEWADSLSKEYEMWSDSLSDVYDEWSDFRSDIYDFWSDLKSDLWDDDTEAANNTIADFQEDIQKLTNN